MRVETKFLGYTGNLMQLSNVLLVFLVNIIGTITIICYSFIMATFFLILYVYVKRKIKRVKQLVSNMNIHVDILENIETLDVGKPFFSTFWIFLGIAVSFLIFPVNIAVVSCLFLAISDVLANLVGKKFGKHKLMGRKTFEGTLAFLISAFAIAFIFFQSNIAIVGAVGATLFELLPSVKPFDKLKKIHILDDNFLIPVGSSFLMWLALNKILFGI